MLTQIFGGISAIGGLLGAQGAARRAQQQRQALLDTMLREAQGNYLDDQTQNNRTLQREAGLGADAVRSLGANLGGALAGAGVYNSSAVAGAMGNAQRSEQSALADLASRLQASALDRKQRALSQVRGIQLGVAGDNVGNTQNDLQTARGGLQSYLGNLVQSNLMRSGANAARTTIPPIVNGTINQGPNLPGNAGMGLNRDWGAMLNLSPGNRPPSLLTPGGFDAWRRSMGQNPSLKSKAGNSTIPGGLFF
jgi:hypothetical protein